jgi:hypothetical protein
MNKAIAAADFAMQEQANCQKYAAQEPTQSKERD